MGKNQCICFVGVLLTPEVAGFQLSHHSLGHDQLSEVLNVPKIAKTPGYPNFLTEGPAQTVLHLKLQSFTCTPWLHGNSTKHYNTAKKLSGETGVQFQPPNMCQLRVFDSDSQVQPEMHLINPFSGNACDICKEVTTNTIDAQMRIGPSHVGQVLPWGCHLNTFQHRVLKIAILAILVCFLVLWKPIDLLNRFVFEAEEHIEVAKFEVTSRWFGIQRTWNLKPPLWGPCCNPGAFFAECFEKPLHGANQPKLLDENERIFNDAEWMKKWLKQGLGKKLLFLTSTSSIWSVYLHHGRSSAKLPPSWSPGKQTPKPCWSAPAAILNCHVIHVPTHSRTHCTFQLPLLWTKFRNAANHVSLQCVGTGCNETATLPLLRICAWDPAEEAVFPSLSNDHGPPGSSFRNVYWVYCPSDLSDVMALLPVCFYIKAAHHEFGLGSSEMITIKEVFPGWFLRCLVKATKAHHGGILVGSKIDAGI